MPALDGVVDKLSAGAKVADIGCGHGVSTTLIAQAFPKSTVHGFDYHDASIDRARELAAEQGVDNAEFAVASATSYPGHGYDLVCYFDCLHDMGDPVGALRHARETLADDGTVMLVEPFANDSLVENLNPVGRMYYAASTLVCTPSSLDQPVALGLGAQAGQQRLGAIAAEAGFGRFRRATETPFNLVWRRAPEDRSEDLADRVDQPGHGQGYPVEASADLHNRGGLASRGHREARGNVAGAFDKQGHRRGVDARTHRQRGHQPQLLVGDPQSFAPAGRQHPHRRRVRQDRLDQIRRSVAHVLAVVEHQQPDSAFQPRRPHCRPGSSPVVG